MKAFPEQARAFSIEFTVHNLLDAHRPPGSLSGGSGTHLGSTYSSTERFDRVVITANCVT